jgi:hypothetical protein
LKQSAVEACLLLAGMDVVPEAPAQLKFDGDVLWSLRPHGSGSYEGAAAFALPTMESEDVKPPKIELTSKLRFSIKVMEPSLAGIILSIFLITLPAWIGSDTRLSNT